MTLRRVPTFTMTAIVGLGFRPKRSTVRGTGVAAQRGVRGVESGDESTAIGALRSALSRLLSHGGDTQLRK